MYSAKYTSTLSRRFATAGESGEKAIELGLVDAYGSTLSIAREMELEDIVDFTPQTSLLESIADRLGVSIGRSIAAHFAPGLKLN